MRRVLGGEGGEAQRASDPRLRAQHRSPQGRCPWIPLVFASVLLLTLAACFPPVTRGPQIETGFSAGATFGGTAGEVTYPVGDAGGNRLRNAVKGVYLGYGRSPRDPTSFVATGRSCFLRCSLMPTPSFPRHGRGTSPVGSGSFSTLEPGRLTSSGAECRRPGTAGGSVSGTAGTPQVAMATRRLRPQRWERQPFRPPEGDSEPTSGFSVPQGGFRDLATRGRGRRDGSVSEASAASPSRWA